MKKIIRQVGFLTIAILAIFAVAAFAQGTTGETPPIEPIEWQTIAAILATGIFGIPVQGITQVVKEAMRKYLKFPDAHWVGWLASALAVVPSAFLYLKPLGKFSWENLLAASVIGWMVANGFYKKETAIQKDVAKLTAEETARALKIL